MGYILVLVKVDGRLMPPDGSHMWPKNNSKRQWLVFYRINGMSLQGGGLIDGRGQKWLDLPCKPHKGINRTTLSGPCDSPIVSCQTSLKYFVPAPLQDNPKN
ncbi:hypothetical protein REPUB_Repub12eG0138900 [Reevesia pubescens]